MKFKVGDIVILTSAQMFMGIKLPQTATILKIRDDGRYKLDLHDYKGALHFKETSFRKMTKLDKVLR